MLDSEQVKARKRELLKMEPHYYIDFKDMTPFVCDTCPDNGKCESAFDPYNIGDGDEFCLEMK